MENSQAGQSDSHEHTITSGAGSSDTNSLFEPGSILLERYQVMELLGKGGMGRVYRVRHLHLQCDYALKALDAQASESTWRRFENEARAANRLDHPNLIKVYDSGLLPDGQPFFVMELVSGATLADILKRDGRLPVLQTLNIFIQVGFALAYAHENGVIHRDLKPSNIMLVENGANTQHTRVKIVDLGIAKLTGVDEYNQQTLTKTGEIFGSPLYMSPEQCLGIAVDRRSDLYSLGCAMYETLTGAPPMVGDSALSTMMKHQSEKPLSLKEASMGLGFPQAVEQVLMKLLEKNPEDRYSNAQLLTSILVNIQQDLQAENSQLADFSGRETTGKVKSTRLKSAICARNLIAGLVAIALYLLGYINGKFTVAPSAPSITAESPNSAASKSGADTPDNFLVPPEEYDKTLSDPSQGMKHRYFSQRLDATTLLFEFPQRSIGTIGVYVPPQFMDDEKKACGKRKLPDKPIAFSAHELVHSELLDKFRPGELSFLAVKQSPCNSSRLLQSVARQKNLQYLRLIKIKIRDDDFDSLFQLKKLRGLVLASCGLRGAKISTLPVLLKLELLDVSQTSEVSKLLEKLSKSKALKYLTVKSDNINDEDLQNIGRITSLIDLNLNENPHVNADSLQALVNLPHLSTLHLENCSLSPDSISKVKELKSLRKLYLSSRTFTVEQASQLNRQLRPISIYLDSQLLN